MQNMKENEDTKQGLNCRNTRCQHLADGKCSLPVDKITINAVGECGREQWGKPV